MDTSVEAVRRRLGEAMAFRGVNQSELARRMEMRQPTVSAWFSESKPAEPMTEALAKIPGALGISGHWLLTGEGMMEARPANAEKMVGVIRELVAPTSGDESAGAWGDRVAAALEALRREGQREHG